MGRINTDISSSVAEGGRKIFTFTRHKFLLVTVKVWLKSVLNYRSYPKNKTGGPFFGPPCRLHYTLEINLAIKNNLSMYERTNDNEQPIKVFIRSDVRQTGICVIRGKMWGPTAS